MIKQKINFELIHAFLNAPNPKWFKSILFSFQLAHACIACRFGSSAYLEPIWMLLETHCRNLRGVGAIRAKMAH
jgi:hypothetical protein